MPLQCRFYYDSWVAAHLQPAGQYRKAARRLNVKLIDVQFKNFRRAPCYFAPRAGHCRGRCLQ